MQRNKKSFIMGALIIGASLLVSSITTSSILAEGDKQQSNASVEFTAPDSTKPVVPVDPTDPTKPLEPINPDDGKGTESTGPLTIDYVPHFKFGKTEIDGSIKTLNSTSKRPYIQVSDRRATGEGWTLSAEMGNFVNGTHSIKDATLELKNGAVKTTDDSTTTGRPTTTNSITLTSDGSKQNIMNATKGQGMGTWLVSWLAGDSEDLNENAVLKISTKDALVGTYESEINWTLSQQP